MLTKTERLFEGKVFGPESMAVDSKGKYNGLVDWLRGLDWKIFGLGLWSNYKDWTWQGLFAVKY